MKVTIVEGTPDEIRQMFPHLAAGTGADAGTAGNGNLPADVQQVLDLARPVEREAVLRFVETVSSWDGIEVKAGTRRAGGQAVYVRFHRRGRGAAFAYLFPRRMYVRPNLPAKELTAARYAKVRGGRAGQGDQSRNLALSPQDAWEEAVKFTMRAYQAAGE